MKALLFICLLALIEKKKMKTSKAPLLLIYVLFCSALVETYPLLALLLVLPIMFVVDKENVNGRSNRNPSANPLCPNSVGYLD